MKPPSAIRGLIRRSALVLRAASILVPREKRAEWFREWYAEIWHRIHFLHESNRLSQSAQMALARDCWGSFADAAWLRFDRAKVMQAVREVPCTARFCLWSIGLLLLTVLVGSGFAPTIRAALAPMPYSRPQSLADLSFSGMGIYYPMDNLFNMVPVWEEKSQTTESVAAYSWTPSRITTPGGLEKIVSARVSSGFFDVLGVKAKMGRLFRTGDERDCPTCVVLSNRLWAVTYGRDPGIVGRHILLEDRDRIVIGVLPPEFRFAARDTAIWNVTTPGGQIFNFADRTGVVLRLHPGTPAASAHREFSGFIREVWPVFGFAEFRVQPISDRMRQGMNLFLLFTVITFIGSLALLSRQFFNAGAGTPLRFPGIAKWWAFFAAKTLLLLLTCFIGSIEGVRLFFVFSSDAVPAMASAVSTWIFLITNIVALTWSLKDQRRRCRICMRLLTHEAYVGVPGYLFLDYWGTELVCSHGHGMLHMPTMDASWLEVNHWTELDPSWQPLFETEEINVI